MLINGYWNGFLTFKEFCLTHWGRVTHICVSNLTSIASDNGLSPDRRQAIIRTNAGILLIWPFGTNFNEILIGIQTFSFKKMHLKVSSVKWRPFCLGLNELKCFRILYASAPWKPNHILSCIRPCILSKIRKISKNYLNWLLSWINIIIIVDRYPIRDYFS